jgi:hypothetical protein
MLHDIFDIEEWQKKCPLTLLWNLDPYFYEGKQITSPASLLANVAARYQLPVFQDAPSVPTDVFVFGLGEPTIPYVTKVGGVPFRPANKLWPEHDGRKMTFLAQFCFSDSLDLVSFPLPGNLLEIFFTDFPNIERDTYYHYEWYNWEEVNEPMKQDDVPIESFLRANFVNNIMNWYCVKYRTADYPQAELFVSAHPNMRYVEHDRFNRRLQGYQIGTGQDFDKFIPCAQNLLRLAVFDGTKIGGTDPFFYGKTKELGYGSEIVRDRNNHFLCSLASIQPKYYASAGKAIPYPFVNHPAPIHDEGEHDQYSLLILDVGRFHFYISTGGEMFCEWST